VSWLHVTPMLARRSTRSATAVHVDGDMRRVLHTSDCIVTSAPRRMKETLAVLLRARAAEDFTAAKRNASADGSGWAMQRRSACAAPHLQHSSRTSSLSLARRCEGCHNSVIKLGRGGGGWGGRGVGGGGGGWGGQGATHIENLQGKHADADASGSGASVMRYRVDEGRNHAGLREEVAGARPHEQGAGALQARDQHVVAGLRAQLLHEEIDAAAAHHGMRGGFVAVSRAAKETAQLEHVVHAQNVTIS
jgi:hypothetical protein